MRAIHDWFLRTFGGPIIDGLTMRQWVRLLRANRFSVAPRHWGRAAMASGLAAANSLAAMGEDLICGKRIAAAQVRPPLFILGCWRSGTTHLHNLMSKDTRFAFPNSYQVFNPNVFLLAEWWNAPLQNLFYPRTRAMDNVSFATDQPQEDEFAIAAYCGLSPMMSLVFWSRRHFYNRYTAFQDVPRTEIEEWQQALGYFLRKLTVKYDKPLLLKSPAHTAKIDVLLEMFPEAKFVMIHRHPYDVLVSGVHMCHKNLELTTLQPVSLENCTTETIEHYGQLFDAYFAQRNSIPEGRLIEIAFEELESEPLESLRKIYFELQLPEFAEAEPRIREYIHSLVGYQKNRHRELDSDIRQMVASRWHHCFSEWGYEPTQAPASA